VSLLIVVIAAAGGGVWVAMRDAPDDAPVGDALTAEATLARILASDGGVAAADWVKTGRIEAVGESGNFARFRVVGTDGREAIAFLVRLSAGTWHLVSLTEGPPQCAAVEKFGFPAAMISDCTVGAVLSVADALAAAIAGGDVSGVRLVGTIEMPADPSCGCVMLSSGGASVRLSLTEAQLRAAGISIGDTVVISGGLGQDLSLDATSVILSDSSGTAASVSTATGGGSEDAGSGSDEEDDDDDDEPTSQPPPREPVPEPTPTPPAQTPGVTPGGSVSGFPEWQPRRRYTTAWYTTPLDLDFSSSDLPNLTGN
jgi:hypothetical protein